MSHTSNMTGRRRSRQKSTYVYYKRRRVTKFLTAFNVFKGMDKIVMTTDKLIKPYGGQLVNLAPPSDYRGGSNSILLSCTLIIGNTTLDSYGHLLSVLSIFPISVRFQTVARRRLIHDLADNNEFGYASSFTEAVFVALHHLHLFVPALLPIRALALRFIGPLA